MSTGYQDWHSLTFLQEQSAEVYFADLFRLVLEDQVVTATKLVDANKTLYCWDTLTVQEDGRILLLGAIALLGD